MKRFAKSITIYLLFLLGIAGQVTAQVEVNKEELDAGKNEVIEFVNYQGPHTVINSREEIRGIGNYLGKAAVESDKEYSFNGKYSIIHVLGEEQTDLIGADIFIISAKAEVDHIRNLRWMISSYLAKAYGYSLKDADLLAEFITVYNAVFRQNIDYMKTKYNSLVIKHLVSDKVGLSKIYSQWPGQSQIIIPLSRYAEKGVLSSLKSDELTDQKVVDELRTGEDMGLEQRKSMVELKEREVQETRDAIEESKKALDETEEQLRQEKKELIEQAEADRVPANVGDGSADQQKIEEVDKKLAEVEAKKEDLKKQEEAQTDRVATIQAEREGIAEDTATVLEREGDLTASTAETSGAGASAQSSTVKKVYFIKVNEVSGSIVGTVAVVNADTGRILKESTINAVRNRWVLKSGEKIVVLAGREGPGGAIRFMTLNPDTLEVETQGKDDIYKDTDILVIGEYFFAVFKDDNVWRVGKYDVSLERKTQSVNDVDPVTSITSGEGMLFVQGVKGDIVRLGTDLKTVE